LIRSTCDNISHIIFPAGDSIQYSGWDGVLQAELGTEYIPEGGSVWEFGTNQEIKEKAERDYLKRTANPLGIDPSMTTFVFVTPRIWPNKDMWCREKREDRTWKDVRVYDAEFLEEWIEQAPAVGAWLAKYLNIFPDGLEAADDFWKEWTCETTPPLTAELVVAGRQKQVEAILNWLKSPPDLLIIQAASKEEALAFLVAVIQKQTKIERENFFSRCLIAEDIKSFRGASTTRNNLFLVNRFEETEAIGKAIQNGHHVYLPVGPDQTVIKTKIILPRLEREMFVSALKAMGIGEEKAQKYSRDTGRSLSVLRRQLSNVAKQPYWARQETAREIIPALLIGRWTEKKCADREAISHIVGESYEALSGRLAKWLVGSDSPLYKIGDEWRLTSPIDAWFALAPYLTCNDFENFRNVALGVLGTVNPVFELEPDERWKASIYGKEVQHSEWLREGIAQTLVLIAVFGEQASIQTNTAPQTWVDTVVKELLHQANWQKWSSLTDVLPLIAEASPNSFLYAVETSLVADEPAIVGMFSESDKPLTPSSAHTGLLWALEGLAWSPTLLGRVTSILGKLTHLDPGGKLANRPANSLREIFLLWHPQTFASLDTRICALDMLIHQEPEVGWDSLISLMPHRNGISSPTYKTRWRQFSEKNDHSVTYAEYYKGVTALVEKLLKCVGCNGYRWGTLIEGMPDLPVKERQAVIECLSLSAEKIELGREEVCRALRNMLSRHRSFPDTDWALPESVLLEIEKIYSMLQPLNVRNRFTWLFDSHWPELPEGQDRGDYHKQNELVEQHRKKAVQQIRDVQGINGIFTLAKEVKEPSTLGVAIAQLGVKEEEEDKIFSLLGGDNEEAFIFAQGFVFYCGTEKGNDWISQVVKKSKDRHWPLDMVVSFLVALPENREVWNHVETYRQEVRVEYWKKCRARFFHLSSDDKTFGVKQLLSVGKFFTALETAALVADDLPSSLVLEILQNTAFLPRDIDDKIRFSHHNVVRLFEALDKAGNVDDKQMAQLEWAYLPILSMEWSGRPPRTLHKELARDPAFFAQVIKWIYKPKDDNIEQDEQETSPELVQQRVRLAYDLLTSWRIIPGIDSNGQIDADSLLKWVDEARNLCITSGRGQGGDSHIGQLLALAGPENEDIWPPEPICRVIDKTQSVELENGFYVGIKNKRGTVTKSAFEGGDQERVLANRFRRYSEKYSVLWPRTASVLSSIAESYENEAKVEDKEAQKRDLEY
jgi:hypothetical protein